MVPKIIVRTITLNKNIKILVLLAFKAVVKLSEAPKYLVNFSILNTLSNLKARSTINAWAPPKIKETYFGIVANKSIIP